MGDDTDNKHIARKILLDRGANPWRSGHSEGVPQAFLIAIERSDVQCFKLLVNVSSRQALEEYGPAILLAAIKTGSTSMMEYLVRLPNIEVPRADAHNRNALHLTSMSGNSAALRFLLKQSAATISDLDNEGRTALHYAIMHNHVDIVRLLLPRASSDILRMDFQGLSPLDHAVKLDSAIIVRTLVDSILYDDPQRRQAAVLCHALSECYSKNGFSDQGTTGELAGYHLPSIEILRLLLDSKHFDVNTRDSSGRTALHHAVFQPYWLSESLRKTASSRTPGINVNVSDKNGRTPIFQILDAEIAASLDYNEEEWIDMARTPKFELWKEFRNSKTEAQKEKLKILIDAGADVHWRRAGGRKIVHDLAQRGDQASFTILRLLLRESRIVLDVEDDDGLTPICFARGKVRQLLLSAPGLVNRPQTSTFKCRE